MSIKTIIAASLTALVLSASGTAALAKDLAAKPADRADFNFGSLGGIKQWNSDDDKEVWFEGNNRQWYVATLSNDCPELGNQDDFYDSVKFVVDPQGASDKLSAVIYKNKLCRVTAVAKRIPPDTIFDELERAYERN